MSAQRVEKRPVKTDRQEVFRRAESHGTKDNVKLLQIPIWSTLLVKLDQKCEAIARTVPQRSKLLQIIQLQADWLGARAF